MSVDLTRQRPPSPYEFLPSLPTFTLSSEDVSDGQPMATRHTAVGENTSPHLSWSGAPAGTASYVVSCFDPDAPSPSGFWHWTIIDLPPSVTSLATGTGESDLLLDGAACHIRNDAGTHAWYGPQPPAGDGPHRYVFAVHALDVPTLDVDDDTPAGAVACQVAHHAIARATLTATFAIAGTSGATDYLQGEL